MDPGAVEPGRPRRGDPGISGAARGAAGVGRLLLADAADRSEPPAARGAARLDEAERLIAEAAAAAPEAIEPALLRARLLLEQRPGAGEGAYDELETARAQFPKDPRPWTARAELLIRQGKFDERSQARALLDRARQQLGDRVELRLARMRLVASRGGPQVVPALNELARGLEAFSREDRRRLLTALAAELGRQQDLEGATGAWARLVEEEPESLQPRLQLFDLALQAGDGKQAEEQIRKVEQARRALRLVSAGPSSWPGRRAPPTAAAKEEAAGRGPRPPDRAEDAAPGLVEGPAGPGRAG